MSAPTTRQWLRAAATRVYTGTGRLAAHHTRRAVGMARSVYGRLAAWVNTSTGVWWLAKIALLLFLASRARLVLGALAERAYERVDSGAWGWLLWTAATLWVVAAYRAGREEWQPSQRPTPMAPDSEQTEEADVEQTPASPRPAPPPVSPVGLIAAVRDIGTPHAQLVPLAEYLRTTTEQVRAAADRMGWEVKDVRMKGRSSTLGLRWDEAPTPPPPTPLESVVGAGQRADDDNDDATGEANQKGFRVERIGLPGTVVHDPADTERHHQITN